MVAYSKLHPGLLAITEEGYYDPSKQTEVEAFDSYMEMTKNQLQELGVNNITLKDSMKIIDSSLIVPFDPDEPVINPDLVEYKFEKKVLESWEHLPNYNLRWGQLYPEGYYCPNGVCGCTNLSMAMIMSYFKYPKSMDITYDTLQHYTNIVLDWDKIKNHKQSFYAYSNDSCSISEHEALGLLCRELGHRNKSGYIPVRMNPFISARTSTPLGNEIETFKSLGFTCSNYTYYSFWIIKEALSSGKQVLVHGVNELDSDYSHLFIIDGGKYEKWWSGEYIREYGKDWELVNDHGISQSALHHINWGYNGKFNGYFSSDCFNGYGSTSYDKTSDANLRGNVDDKSYTFTNITIATVTINK